MTKEPFDTLKESDINRLQLSTLGYYLHETNPLNGLVRDKTDPGAPCSIAAVGMSLSSAPILIERGVVSREFTPAVVASRLEYLLRLPQGPGLGCAGYKGFFYHFLDMKSGLRAGTCEVSTLDSAFLFAGALTCAAYFDGDNDDERRVRELAHELYARADWLWAMNGSTALSHGWRPEGGFLPHYYRGYDEALILYILGLGSPTYPLPATSYLEYCSTYQWKSVLGREYLHSGPLFTHQLSHLWIDFRGIQDDFMRTHQSDYFTNSRQATLLQRDYAILNPMQHKGYGENCWGVTASDGPGWVRKEFDGIERQFFDYYARGVPDGPDDGTLAPWAVLASLPFAPEVVIPTINHMATLNIGVESRYGFKPSFNPTYSDSTSPTGWWVSPFHFGIDQGPVILMVENYRTGLMWDIVKRSPYIRTGLRRAGFRGGWLKRYPEWTEPNPAQAIKTVTAEVVLPGEE